MTRRLAPIVIFACLLVACGHGKKTAKTAAPKGPPPPTQHFRSRPDLRPPLVHVVARTTGTADGDVFLAPKMKVLQAGPMILDDRGRVVWFKPLDTHGVSDFRVQRFHGTPVLTWWRGRAPMGVGSGYYAVYDDTYRQVARVRAGHGYDGDIHEFVITPRDTALFTVYHQVHVDLSPEGGPKQGRIFEGIVQEVDIRTGRVLFEWHSYPAVGLRESFVPPPKRANGAKAVPWDYFHINSIDEEPGGKLLISARNTHAVYELDRKTHRIVWRLGGKQSDFRMGPGTTFAWQHDARRQDDGTITLFDNGAAPPVEKFSRILVVRVDERTRRATLARSYRHPRRLLVPFEGNAQFLPDGHVFVGWGAIPDYTEFARSGRVLLDVRFGSGHATITGPNQDADSYRAYRFVWHAHPVDRPAVVLAGGSISVSWNGATEVSSWQFLGGPDAQHLSPIATVVKRGFETAIAAPDGTKAVLVRAFDRQGALIGGSKVVQAIG